MTEILNIFRYIRSLISSYHIFCSFTATGSPMSPTTADSVTSGTLGLYKHYCTEHYCTALPDAVGLLDGIVSLIFEQYLGSISDT